MDDEERRSAQVEVPPTRVRRVGRAPYLVLALGTVAIAGAVAVAQLAPAPVPEPIAFDLPTRSPATPAPTSTLATTTGTPPEAVPPRLTSPSLGGRIRDGSLDGRLVFVDGTLEATEIACRPPWDGRGGPCMELAIPGLGVEVVAEPVAMPWRGTPPAGAWVVTVAREGRLGYLGSLVPDPSIPDDPTELVTRLDEGDLADPPGSLFQVHGFLVTGQRRTCVRSDPIRTTLCPPPPLLAADEPVADGTLRSGRGATVDLAQLPVDVDPSAPVTAGVFLLVPPETCDLEEPSDACRQLDWTVVARYEPSRAVRVLVP